MANVFTILGADHQEVKQMLAELESATTPEARGSVAEKLVIEESKHEAVEEMHLWPAVREHVAGGDELAEKALGQEDEGKKVLDDIRKAQPSDVEFVRLIETFARAGREHIAFEEEQVWPKLRAALSPEQQEELGAKIESSKQGAPTRPHPNAPSSGAAQKAAGPAAGLIDKARDAVTGRG